MINKEISNPRFQISDNIIYYFDIKSEQIIKSVFVFKIYNIITGVDIGFYIQSILQIIIAHLDLPEISVIVYIDLYLLYKYLVKFDTTKGKYLIIDIIVTKQLNTNKVFIEIKWIDGLDDISKIITNRILIKYSENWLI